jgi:Putative phage serine protease XkdF
MKIVELILDEEQDGVYAISLVESPAIKENFIALSKEHKIEFKEIENKKNILLGAVLIPDMLIDRKDKQGEIFQIFLSGETITKVAHKYMMQGNQSNTTLQHKSDVKGVTVVETWLKEDAVHDKSVKYGFDYPLNTWLVSMYVENDDIKEKIIKGEVKGFSIEGIFQEAEDKRLLEKLKELLTNN